MGSRVLGRDLEQNIWAGEWLWWRLGWQKRDTLAVFTDGSDAATVDTAS